MVRFLLAALALFLAASPAAAWWDYGHQTVAEIAWANIRPQTRAAITRLLRHQAALDTPTCPVRTIAEASTWADCIKPLKDAAGKSRFGYAYGWHFQDVNVCKPFDVASVCKDGNCVSAQIDRQAALLRSGKGTRVERLEALAFLVHFVGDLHQPLHAGERDDQGGNKLLAAYGDYAPAKLNLHSVWDGLIAERAISTPPSLVKHYPAAERRSDAAGTVTDWSREMWQVSRDVTYASALGGDACGPEPERARLDNATIARLVPTARDLLVKGGLRLARMLDDSLGGRRRRA